MLRKVGQNYEKQGKLFQIPIQYLNLTAYLVRKTSDNQREYRVCKESKQKLGKVRKVILNNHTALKPSSLFSEKNQEKRKLQDV